jgi:folylpolyglutamate synthase/dihydropteroate synthase
MLGELARLGDALVATSSSNARSMPASELASHAAAHFRRVEVVDPSAAALARAHELGDPVLVTGSLYLLADLERTAEM